MTQPPPDPFMDAIEPFVNHHRATPRRDNAALDNARWLAAQEQQNRRAAESDFLKAIRLAPTLEILEALLRNEAVPLNQLDPYWVKSYGL